MRRGFCLSYDGSEEEGKAAGHHATTTEVKGNVVRLYEVVEST